MNITREQIGRRMRWYRRKIKMTQWELAKKNKIQQSYISLIEKGLRWPSLSRLEQIAKALKIPVVLLLDMTDKKINR